MNISINITIQTDGQEVSANVKPMIEVKEPENGQETIESLRHKVKELTRALEQSYGARPYEPGLTAEVEKAVPLSTDQFDIKALEAAYPFASNRDLAKAFKISFDKVKTLQKKHGWKKDEKYLKGLYKTGGALLGKKSKVEENTLEVALADSGASPVEERDVIAGPAPAPVEKASRKNPIEEMIDINKLAEEYPFTKTQQLADKYGLKYHQINSLQKKYGWKKDKNHVSQVNGEANKGKTKPEVKPAKVQSEGVEHKIDMRALELIYTTGDKTMHEIADTFGITYNQLVGLQKKYKWKKGRVTPKKKETIQVPPPAPEIIEVIKQHEAAQPEVILSAAAAPIKVEIPSKSVIEELKEIGRKNGVLKTTKETPEPGATVTEAIAKTAAKSGLLKPAGDKPKYSHEPRKKPAAPSTEGMRRVKINDKHSIFIRPDQDPEEERRKYLALHEPKTKL